MRYFLEISYNGTNYHGWQIQPNGITIQAVMDKALSTILHDDIRCNGCGRTDAGVHARQFYLHFDTKKTIAENLVFKVNAYLPYDISIQKILSVDELAHTRFDATERSYEYRMNFFKSPFLKEFSYYCRYPKPDISLMNQAANLLLTYEDFAPLCKASHGAKTTLCDVNYAMWEENETDELLFTIKSNRFLRGMVRKTVGVMLMLGLGKMTMKEFEQTMNSIGQFKYVMPIPPQGLYLTQVKYPYI